VEKVLKSTLKSILLLIHYWFPVALGWSIALVIHRATGSLISPLGIDLYLLGIWAAYSLDRLLDQSREVRQSWLTASLLIGFMVSAALGAILVIQLSPKTISAIVLFSIITILYSKAKKIPFLKTVLVAIVWTWAGVALPFQNQNWFAWQFWTMQTSLPLVMLIAAGVILCDFKDLKFDGQDGVRSLPVMFGLRNTSLATSALLLIAAVISYQQGRIGLVISSAALIGLAQFPFILSLDTIGPLLVDIALTLPGLMIFLHLV
jgi:4-hydroxybenzoate polyprenyltransferase